MTTTYRVLDPDGTTVHLIQGPDNASPADVQAFAAQSIPKPSASQAATAQQIANDPISQGAKAGGVLQGDGTFLGNLSANAQNFAAGAGKAVSDVGSGIGQILGMTPQSQVDQTKQLDAPLMASKAGLAGDIGGNIAMTLLPAGILAKGADAVGMTGVGNAARAFVNPSSAATAAGTAAAAVGGGALQGAIQPVASDESRLVNTAAGAAAGGIGQGAVTALGRIAQPIQNALDPIAQKAVNTLQGAGVPLDLAQVTGSPVLNRLRSSMSDNMFTLGKQSDIQGAQQGAYNNALLNLIGESGTAATPDVMGGALNRTNQVFSDVLGRNNVPMTPTLATGLADAQAGALENQKMPVVNIVNRAFDSVDPTTGALPGQTAYNLVKDMRNMRAGAGQDTTLANFAGNARSAMMNGVNDALSGPDLQAFTQARQQQAMMHTMEGAVNPQTGDISASKLANILGQKRNRSTSIYGQGPQDLNDLAQAGKMILSNGSPNSGTAARAIAAATIPGLALGGIDAGYNYMQDGDLGGAVADGAKMGAGVIAAPKMAQWIMNNPTMVNMLSNGVTNPAMRSALQAPAQNALVGQLARQTPNALYKLLMQPDQLTMPTTVIRGGQAAGAQ